MNNSSPSTDRLTSMSSLAFVAAALIAVAAVGVAISRSSGGEADSAAPHGSTKPDQPVGTVEEKIKQLELKLAREPNDPAGWRMLGWSHFETGDLTRSAVAYRRAAEFEPGNAENWSSLGEALQSASTEVSPEAAGAFERALKLDPADPRARYFRAVQKDLQGRHEPAISDWIALLKDTPPGAPWEADLRRTILQVADKHKIDIAGRMPAATQAAPTATAATAAIPGPTPQELAAASSIPPQQQSEMVKGMVDRLANRLKQNPKDADGWMRLMRARMVLGQTEAAGEAYRSGLSVFQRDPAAQAALNQAAQELGVPRG